jgi:formylglycine-generating enzyme required for sulfatase activity
MDWDVFISHAWEDKEAFARPLAKALEEKGLRVWYDEFTLTLGDSLRRSIDRGLAQSRYGVVILSPHFFAKEWPQKELDGLAAREAPGEKVILPVWHNITAERVREHSPTLADRVAVSSDRGIEHVVSELLRVIKPASEPTHRLRFEKVQYSTEVAQILRHYEGKRIKANRKDKHNQYFVHKGRLHLLDVDAARVCDERIGPFEDLDPDKDFVLDIKERKGSPYNRPKMIKVLDSIEAEETREAEKRQVTISLLKQESATSIRLPLDPEMVPVPAGEFFMGTREEDVDEIAERYNIDCTRIEREVPQHEVFAEKFEMGRYPVTNFQYQAFVQDTGHESPRHWEGNQYPEGLDNHPVVNVSWHDAMAFCKWLSKKTGKPYRLPTEAEWEKAARGGVQIPNPQNPGELVDNPHPRRRYSWGDEFDTSKCNTAEGGLGSTSPVGRYFSDGDNPYGLADMAGNVWEWCTDCLQRYPGNSSPDDDYGKTRVLRGSSWKTYGLAHCTFRYARTPESREDDMGFRCVRDLPFWQRVLLRLKGLILGRAWLTVLRSSAKHTPAKTRRPVNWEKVGAIAQVISLIGLPIAVIGVLIALGTWLWPDAADFIFARPSETPTVTPTSSPTHTPVIFTATPTNTSFPPTATSTLTPLLTDTPTPLPPTDTPTPASPPAVAEAGQVWVSPIDGAEMVYVPAGEFIMGSTDADVDSALAICNEAQGGICERNWFEDERPQHTVYLDAFYIDKTEVTNERFAHFVAETGYHTEAERQGWGWVWKGSSEGEKVTGADWLYPHGPNSSIEDKMDHPVVLISWNDADAYCQWAGKRLPTEAEWEKAARSADGRMYPWGEGIDCDHAQYDECDEETVPVGSKLKGVSPYGAMDMAGNVWEWVSDWYDPDYYSQSLGYNPSGPDYGGGRVLRGAAWFNIWLDLRCTNRHSTSPNLMFNDIGFRCAKSPQ